MSQTEQEKNMGRLIKKCWEDEGFKNKLIADPAGTLKSLGAELPPGHSIKVVADTPQVSHLVIPARPDELSDAQLDAVAGGFFDIFTEVSCHQKITWGHIAGNAPEVS